MDHPVFQPVVKAQQDGCKPGHEQQILPELPSVIAYIFFLKIRKMNPKNIRKAKNPIILMALTETLNIPGMTRITKQAVIPVVIAPKIRR